MMAHVPTFLSHLYKIQVNWWVIRSKDRSQDTMTSVNRAVHASLIIYLIAAILEPVESFEGLVSNA